ncbi:PREDICTED: putative nuclease HARBI1 [Cyphomyrmex costatus]|uniref:putative nuclease HARBI1 n=1 Tax=Cyphomyrmex costatus TaxID=456900 RepID=UPI0008523DB8|nr:PREDICTED: putative nuclease HARBI1 [Cyphomyrmex costatus]
MDIRNIYEELFEDDGDDDDYQILNLIRKPYTVRPRPDFFNIYDEREFITRFRLCKETVIGVADLICDKIKTKTLRNNAIMPIHQLLLTLRFYATGAFQIAVADFAGIHTSTACRIIKKVTIALASEYRRYVRFPEDTTYVRQGFYNISKFPRVIGAIDCTHVKIQSPGGEEAEVFRNRKGFFSINVQVVCNSNMEFQDIVARWPGSTHDATIFDASRLHARFIQGEMKDGILLGDNGYSCVKFLVTPLLQTHNRAEELYNESQIRTRNKIECTFGVWKRRFPVLAIGMRVSIATTQAIVIATAVLHNIARQMNNPEPPVDLDVVQLIDALEDHDPIVIPDNARTDTARRLLIDTYFRLLP